MGYGNKIIGAITLLSATFISATISTSSASPYIQVAQGATVYGPDGQIYTVDENARRNNQSYVDEERRNRRIRRQIRRENRARSRTRARAERQRLYDVRRRENRGRENGGYVQKYDYYGNPIIQPNQKRRYTTYPTYKQPRKARERVKLVYVPIPRAKPYHLAKPSRVIAQKPTSPNAVPTIPTVAAPPTAITPPTIIAPNVIKTATAPIKQSKEVVAKPTAEVATLPKIEIETLPNPSSSKPSTNPPVEVEKPLEKKIVEAPKVETKKPEKKIKYTTFSETLRKIRERNAAQKKLEQKNNVKVVKSTEKPAPNKPKIKPVETKPVKIKQVETKPIKIKKVASLEPAKKPQPTKVVPIKLAPEPKTKQIEIITQKPVIEEAPKPAANQISCKKAQKIIVDYGFSDVKKITCKGKDYNFSAKRDGTPFKITLSALSGELTKVLRQK